MEAQIRLNLNQPDLSLRSKCSVPIPTAITAYINNKTVHKININNKLFNNCTCIQTYHVTLFPWRPKSQHKKVIKIALSADDQNAIIESFSANMGKVIHTHNKWGAACIFISCFLYQSFYWPFECNRTTPFSLKKANTSSGSFWPL